MSRTIVLVLALFGALLAGPGIAAPAGNNDPIPPNCTLNPFTHKMVCHIWPTCTLDPFTGKMNCPVPQSSQVQLQRFVH